MSIQEDNIPFEKNAFFKSIQKLSKLRQPQKAWQSYESQVVTLCNFHL